MILKILIPFLVIVQIMPLLIWLERKGAAYIQDRRGPNRASIAGFRLGGLLHAVADVIKLVTKEDLFPSKANRFVYTLAPFISMAVACMTFAVIPWGAPLTIGQGTFTLQAADFGGGLIYIFAIGSMGVYGIMLAGWGSNNKYSLLGGLRASAQMISYELALSLAVIGVLILAGSVELGEIVSNQGAHVWGWNFVRQPVGCLLFIVAVFAETNRLPFDLPEADSELVAGYHTEYSSLKFALFFMAEYLNMIIASALIVVLFFGGWQVPFVGTEILRSHASDILYHLSWVVGVLCILAGGLLIKKKRKIFYHDLRDFETKMLGTPAVILGVLLIGLPLFYGPFDLDGLGSQIVAAALQFVSFIVKVLFFCWVFVWVRWTLPRFRYDQLMKLGWKVMLPIALLNLLVTAAAVMLF